MRRSGLVALAIVIACTIPVVARADEAQIQAQIALLQQQATQLQKMQSANCTAPTIQLKKGMTGPDVTALQNFLAKRPQLYPSGLVTGYFGPATVAAVTKFQFAYLQVTPTTVGLGMVGPRTLALMRKQAGCSDQNPTSALHATITTTHTTYAGTPANQSANTNAGNPAVLIVSFVSPDASTTAIAGGPLSIAWKTQNAPANSTITLSLENAATNASIGVIAAALRTTGAYFWTIPSAHDSADTCTSALECISRIAETSCGGPFCSLSDGMYRVAARLIGNQATLANARSVPFFIQSGTFVSPSTNTSAATSQSASAFSDFLSSISGGTTVTDNSAYVATGRTCNYSGTPYPDGIVLTVNCADLIAPGTPCPQQYQGQVLTCRNGDWLNSVGATTSIPNVTQVPTGATCKTPWNNQVVGNGQLISYQPYFTGGLFNQTGPVPMMKCAAGSWQKCSSIGDACVAYTVVP